MSKAIQEAQERGILGKQIDGLFQLEEVAKHRRSVIVPGLTWLAKPKPAAVVLSMQAIMVMRMFRLGMYVYTKPGSKETRTAIEAK
jgi:hypothetical protein